MLKVAFGGRLAAWLTCKVGLGCADGLVLEIGVLWKRKVTLEKASLWAPKVRALSQISITFVEASEELASVLILNL